MGPTCGTSITALSSNMEPSAAAAAEQACLKLVVVVLVGIEVGFRARVGVLLAAAIVVVV